METDAILTPSKKKAKITPTSTVGRGRALKEDFIPESPVWSDEFVNASLGDSLDHYDSWDAPTAIISDGGYDVLGFEGDTSDHLGLPAWYEPHIIAGNVNTQKIRRFPVVQEVCVQYVFEPRIDGLVLKKWVVLNR